MVKDIALEVAELVEKKNRDYGNSFYKTIKEYGDTAYFLRVEDKISRLKSLTKKYASVDEVKNYKEYFTDNDGIFGRPEDDFSGITDIGKCIISVY